VKELRQWCRMFKDGQTNVHDEEWNGRPSAVSDDLVQSVDQKICERRCFIISELSCEFPHLSCTVLYEIITDRLGYHKYCARWVQQWVDRRCQSQNMAEHNGGRLLWHRHAKTYSPIQVPQFRWWLHWDSLFIIKCFSHFLFF
jgi:hypothetical protein